MFFFTSADSIRMTDGSSESSPQRAVEHRLVRLAGLLAGLVGLFLLFVGVGTAVDYLVAQSHEVGVVTAFALRAEFTVAGTVLLLFGIGVVRWSSRK